MKNNNLAEYAIELNEAELDKVAGGSDEDNPLYAEWECLQCHKVFKNIRRNACIYHMAWTCKEDPNDNWKLKL